MANPVSVSGFNIAGFLSQVANKGVLRTNKFQCYFMVPQGFSGFTGILGSTVGATLTTVNPLQYAREFSAWCTAANLPDVSFDMMEYQRYSMGPGEKVVRAPKFGGCSVSVIADADGDTRNFFESWLSMVGDYGFVNNNNLNPAPSNYTPFSVGYQDDYVTQLYVSTYDDAGNEISRHCFDRAFPISLKPVHVSWEDTNTYMHFDVDFACAYWYQVPIFL